MRYSVITADVIITITMKRKSIFVGDPYWLGPGAVAHHDNSEIQA